MAEGQSPDNPEVLLYIPAMAQVVLSAGGRLTLLWWMFGVCVIYQGVWAGEPQAPGLPTGSFHRALCTSAADRQESWARHPRAVVKCHCKVLSLFSPLFAFHVE